jgi:lipopolysaccharide transport system ATP-binding protein
MSEIAISVRDLGKQYHIGALQQNGKSTYKSLRESLTTAASKPFRFVRSMIERNQSREDDHDRTIWALRDVSFDVKRGDIVGVIGRNGAGKSTLLKVLARITEPTTGRAEIHGRLGSLLEVGTGFHPELTGRENIYLNGSILGMKRAQISSRFDEIVAFAEVEQFIDTPVKHYSSGMYLRLAFAVAAHLETEVLLVDEVLAVGDYRFQEKCLGKMRDVATTGRTILYVSHSMSSIQTLCKRAIAFSEGRLIADSNPQDVIAEYIGGNLGNIHTEPADPTRPTITKAEVILKEQTLLLSIEFESPFALTPPVFGFVMHNSLGTPVFGTNNSAEPIFPPPEAASAGRFEVAIPAGNFRADRYLFSLWLGDPFTDYYVREMILQANLNNAVGGGLPTDCNGNIYLQTDWLYEIRNLKGESQV